LKITIVQEPREEPALFLHCADPSMPEVQSLLHFVEGLDKRLPVQKAGSLTLLAPRDVLYAEFVGRGVFLYTKNEVHPSTQSLAQLARDWPGFVRCSKSMVVNLHCVSKLRSEFSGRLLATLSNDEALLISRHYAAGLRRRLTSDILK